MRLTSLMTASASLSRPSILLARVLTWSDAMLQSQSQRQPASKKRVNADGRGHSLEPAYTRLVQHLTLATSPPERRGERAHPKRR